MTDIRGPHNSAKCPFYVVPDDPLSATESIDHCVRCVTRGTAALTALREDFKQTAFLTILEKTSTYDPGHPRGASFITFMKSKVCCRLWGERRKALKYEPCGDAAADTETAVPAEMPPLSTALQAAAAASEPLEKEVIAQFTFFTILFNLVGFYISKCRERRGGCVATSHLRISHRIQQW